MRPLLAFFSLVILCLAACESPRRASGPGPSHAGEAESLVFAGWPPLPEVETSATLALAELAADLPELAAADGPAWAEQTFVPWMDERETLLVRAAELRRNARRGSTADQAVSAALFGGVLQATLESLAHARVERIDPAAAQALEPTAGALADKARRAFEVCHQLALDAGVALDGWRRACDDHLSRLP